MQQPTESGSIDFTDVPTNLSVTAAQARITDLVQPLPRHERVTLADTLDRILAAPVHAPFAIPTAANAAMDGYAVCGDDLPSTGERQLTLVGEARAGHPWSGTVVSGQCVRITTGAFVPNGADTVVMQEDAQVSADRVVIGSNHRRGDHVRAAGEELATGQTYLTTGTRLGPAEIALMASFGVTECTVFQRPRVAFFSTGDELVAAGQPLAAGQIYDSNRPSLRALLQRCGCQPIDLGLIPDNPAMIRTVLKDAAATADVVITSGGVSAGKADYLPTAVSELGRIEFWKVAMKPGHPFLCAAIDQAWYFGLPGNPVSVMVSFQQLVRPALLRLAGASIAPVLTLRAQGTTQLKKRPGRVDHQRGIFRQDRCGQFEVKSSGAQGSHRLTSITAANALIVLPAEQGSVEAGEWVDVIPFSGGWW